MVARKCHPISHIGGSRLLLFLCILLFGILCTSYEYIINVTVGSTQYATFVGFGMRAQIKDANQNIVNPEKKTTVIKDSAFQSSNTFLETNSNIEKQNVTEKKMILDEKKLGENKSNLCPEIPIELQGRLKMVDQVVNFSRILIENPTVLVGGESSPANCHTRHNVAIIVPYRNRLGQLAVFLRHMHPILSRQDLHYRIYVINQGDENTFNRAMLMNVGYIEAMQDYNWDCCIFHDVDLLPEDDRNLYTCPDMPRHMSVAVDKFKYKLPYKTIFGGVAAIRVQQFKTLNGFSNQFWGWGGEDDDMSKRIQHHRLKITRYQPEIARYTMIKHKQETVNKERGNILKTSHKRYNSDGLSSLVYTRLSKEREPSYTNVTVQLQRKDTAIKGEHKNAENKLKKNEKLKTKLKMETMEQNKTESKHGIKEENETESKPEKINKMQIETKSEKIEAINGKQEENKVESKPGKGKDKEKKPHGIKAKEGGD